MDTDAVDELVLGAEECEDLLFRICVRRKFVAFDGAAAWAAERHASTLVRFECQRVQERAGSAADLGDEFIFHHGDSGSFDSSIATVLHDLQDAADVIDYR